MNTGKGSSRGRLLTVDQVCPRLGYAKQTLYNRAGALAQLPFFRIGRSIRFSEVDIEIFLEQRRVEPGTRDEESSITSLSSPPSRSTSRS